MAGFIPPHELSKMPPNTPILLGLSGGADSVALLHMLCEYAKGFSMKLAVAHVEHGIRGEDSLRDLAFCRSLAEKEGLAFYAKSVNVPTLAEQNKMSIEEQARAVRYEFFEAVMREHNIPLLATAHNATDNAETMLFRMARGTGLRGLCGIPEARPFGGGLVIRPLLSMSKEEILSYCQSHQLSFVTDTTNSDTSYARNRIRHRILPELTKINEAAVRHFSELAETLSEDEAYLKEQTEKILDREQEGGIRTERFNALPGALAGRVVSALFGDSLSRVHREQLALLSARAIEHSRLDLPHGMTVGIENGRLCRIPNEELSPPICIPTPILWGMNKLEDTNLLILVDSEQNPNENRKFIQNIYKNSTTTHISFDTIKGSLLARPRKEGDTLLIGGMHKKLRKLQNEKDVPLVLRETLPLLCDDEGILWAPLVATRQNENAGDNLWRFSLFWN